MSAICEYCRKQPSVIIRGSHLCSAATLPASGHPECRGDHAPSAAIALISIWRTTLGSA
jgi:hypothetical protein